MPTYPAFVNIILIQSQLHWEGHVRRMSDDHLPKKLLYGELQHEKHSRESQKNHVKDTLIVSLKAFNISRASWECTACDRSEWRLAIQNSANTCEAMGTAVAEYRRLLRKSRNRSPLDPTCIFHALTAQKHSECRLASPAICAPTEKMIHSPHRCNRRTHSKIIIAFDKHSLKT